MTSISHSRCERITVGVDTHKHAHVAVALNEIGGRVAETTIEVNPDGYRQLEQWAQSLGDRAVFGIEGTGSYGAGLASHLRRQGHRVIEVTRPTANSATCVARTTPWTPRTPPAPSWPAPPPPFPRPATAAWR